MKLRLCNHRGLMSLRRVGCVDIYGLDSCFSIDLCMWLLGLLLLILSAVILIVVLVRYFVGASSAVILRSRAASSDLSCFNSSSLPQVFEMIISSWGTSALSFAVRSSYWAMMSGIFSRALTKSIHGSCEQTGHQPTIGVGGIYD